MTRTVIRVDAGDRIGTGHVMRCLTLANALQPNPVTFVCREHAGHLAARIESQGFNCLRLPLPTSGSGGTDDPSGPTHSGWLGASWSQDAVETAGAIERAGGADMLIVDHYGIDRRWESWLRSHVHRLMVIDDIADRAHDADVLLDQNLGANPRSYQQLVPDGCRLLTGPAYALLRPDFAIARPSALRRRRALDKPRSLLITLGGSDTRELEAKILRMVALAGGGLLDRVDLVHGANAGPVAPIERLMKAEGLAGEVHAHVARMAALMSASDIAIGAGGTTVWERCCVGLPTLQLTIADNQKEIGERLYEHGALAGLAEPDDVTVGDIEALLSLGSDDYLELAERASLICDGQGAGRVATELLR